ncbi:hypothetical protein PtA15_10A250 [Puccinia triticina]|uniref:ATPase domain-containing protein n=1 Tax=Puccinia triticina TaxID=208348 RepID=A0ABY7CVZ8_9BASI|nr:uncharacterized protein PtA15_10A250 [Puccinia triticina]WAQ88830.1 hypothetical protein PtA15_10A250 [Puccinia triticina]
MLHSASRVNIKHALRTGTATFHSATPSMSFYNRSREVKHLSDILNGKPAFTVLLGAPSSGKTALTQHVVSRKRADNTPEFHSLTVDLRAVGYLKGSFMEALVNKCLDEKAPTRFWKELLGGSVISYPDLRLKFRNELIHSSNIAGKIFEEMGQKLEPWSFCPGRRPPVLVIEEANGFKDINDDVCLFIDRSNDIFMY